jgi:hypothetical protein
VGRGKRHPEMRSHQDRSKGPDYEKGSYCYRGVEFSISRM